ncbi:hypothetical protein ACFE04_010279 [Oxalis oulophora]
MGSSNSRIEESHRSPDRFKFSSIICGGSNISHAPLEIEDRCDIASSSSKAELSSDTGPVNVSVSIDNSVNCESYMCPNVSNLSGSSPLRIMNPASVENPVEEPNQATAVTNPDSASVSASANLRRNLNYLLDWPTIVLPGGDRNDSESPDRWFLDFAREFFNGEIGNDYRHISSRLNYISHGRRRHSRFMNWGGLHSDIDEDSQRRCYSRLHPEGSCSCDAFSMLMGDSSASSSISQLGLLAETLFEVLEETHRRPVPLSLSTASLPATESVINSFPLRKHKRKNHKKKGNKDDGFQCYICLAEYMDGDKIRVLPCHHEYHMLCVDKWLKEVHGVCPLCRRDVRRQG